MFGKIALQALTNPEFARDPIMGWGAWAMNLPRRVLPETPTPSAEELEAYYQDRMKQKAQLYEGTIPTNELWGPPSSAELAWRSARPAGLEQPDLDPVDLLGPPGLQVGARSVIKPFVMSHRREVLGKMIPQYGEAFAQMGNPVTNIGRFLRGLVAPSAETAPSVAPALASSMDDSLYPGLGRGLAKHWRDFMGSWRYEVPYIADLERWPAVVFGKTVDDVTNLASRIPELNVKMPIYGVYNQLRRPGTDQWLADAVLSVPTNRATKHEIVGHMGPTRYRGSAYELGPWGDEGTLAQLVDDRLRAWNLPIPADPAMGLSYAYKRMGSQLLDYLGDDEAKFVTQAYGKGAIPNESFARMVEIATPREIGYLSGEPLFDILADVGRRYLHPELWSVNRTLPAPQPLFDYAMKSLENQRAR